LKAFYRILGVLAALFVAAETLAETYPERPVRIVVPAPPGGANDLLARVIAQDLSEKLGKRFFVENIAGGGYNLGMGIVARAKPDGHTILAAVSTFMVNPMIHASVPYDPIRDFAPVTLLGRTHFVLVVHPSLPVKDASELIAHIKANPGKYNYASAGVGTTPHLLGELIRQTFGLDLVHVPFNGPQALNTTLAGSTPILFTPFSNALPHVKQGTLRALAVTSKARWAELPDVPTVTEAGLPGEGADTIVGGILVPSGTPKATIDLLHREITRIMTAPDTKARFPALGLEPVGNNPEEFGAYIKAEIARWAKVIRDGNLRGE
jgi:tripartite-type tricarboxylate transporter receptor subunit TctC